MNQFITYELGDICSRLSSGKGISSKSITEEGNFPVYGGNGLRGYTDTYNFDGECAIIGRQGAFCGNVRFFSGKAYMTEHAVVCCANGKHNTRYLAYLLSTMNLGRLSGQSAQPGLSVKTLSKQPVKMPSLEQQTKIASMLSVLEDKIANNNKVNDNLQQQVHALFREWFIDTPEAKLWERGTFADLIERTISGDWGKDTATGNNTEMVYCIRGADIPEVKAGNKGKMPTRFILPKNYATKQLVVGDIVVEISGGSPTQSTGRAAVISDALLARYDKGMVCTNFCKALKPKAGYSMFVYHFWQYLYDSNVFFGYENGTTGIKNLDISGIIDREEIVLPAPAMIAKFDTVCQSMYRIIYSNGLENEQLSTIRDTLLPRLTSGEIDVSDVDF